MKTINFRVWNKNWNYMDYEPTDIFIDGCGDAYEMESTIEMGVPWQELMYKPEYIVMQYTGLTDLAGKKIYDGDIVGFGSDNGFKKDEVFSEGSGFRTTRMNQKEFSEFHDIYEVVGNIYQNNC